MLPYKLMPLKSLRKKSTVFMELPQDFASQLGSAVKTNGVKNSTCTVQRSKNMMLEWNNNQETYQRLVFLICVIS